MKESNVKKIKLIDQLGRSIELNGYPQKIISLVPSITELLFYLGLEQRIVGLTKFCVHPAHARKTKRVVGGTKNVKTEVVRELEPDLVIANKEENVKEQVEKISSFAPVYISDVKDLETALMIIHDLGMLSGSADMAKKLTYQIKTKQEKLTTRNEKKVVYLIWKDPMMTIGGDTYISEMLKISGLKNVFEHKLRYPIINFQDIETVNPDYIFLSSEPYPFKEKERIVFQNAFPNSKAIIVDGEMFSWYGSRLLNAMDYFNELDLD